MEYFDINNLKPIDSAILALRNYILYLYEEDESVKMSIRNVKKFKEDLSNIKEKLELDKHIKSIEYARRMKEFGLIADMLNIEYDKLRENKKKFPIFACLKNNNNEEIYILVYDVTRNGIIVKDKDNTMKLIRIDDFKNAYKNRIFFISDYKQLLKKYYVCNKDYDAYTKLPTFDFDLGKANSKGLVHPAIVALDTACDILDIISNILG